MVATGDPFVFVLVGQHDNGHVDISRIRRQVDDIIVVDAGRGVSGNDDVCGVVDLWV